MSDKRKVVIDCDPGIDDCFALMMCIKHLDVQGIVAVGGNTGLKYTERNARYMTELTGRPDIPVYAGYDMPMINKPVRATEVHGSGGLGTVSIEEPKKQLEKQHGVDYLVEYPFVEKVSRLDPEQFVAEDLTGRMHAEVIVTGPDRRCGYRAAGDRRLCVLLAHQYGDRSFVVD